MEEIKVFVADERHIKYVDTILDTIERAAKIRGTGIAKRSPEYVKQTSSPASVISKVGATNSL